MLYSHGYEHHYQIILRKNLNRYGWNPMSLPHHSVASSPPESRSQLHKRLWLGFTWQTLWSEITNEWKRDFSMVFLWFPTWPLEANFNINHQKPIQPAGTSKCSSRKVLHHTKQVLADRGNAQCVKMPSDFMGLEIWGLFSDKPMIGRIQNFWIPIDPKSENLNLRKLCQNYRLHFAKQGWAKPNAKPRSKRMIPYLESEHPQILSILCTVGICWARIKLRPALALLCRSFSPMQSNLRCQARKTSRAGLVPWRNGYGVWLRQGKSGQAKTNGMLHFLIVWSVDCLIKSTDGWEALRGHVWSPSFCRCM